MDYNTIITKLQNKGYRPISHVSLGKDNKEIVRLELYVSPLLKNDVAVAVKELVGDDFNVWAVSNDSAVYIEKEK